MIYVEEKVPNIPLFEKLQELSGKPLSQKEFDNLMAEIENAGNMHLEHVKVHDCYIETSEGLILKENVLSEGKYSLLSRFIVYLFEDEDLTENIGKLIKVVINSKDDMDLEEFELLIPFLLGMQIERERSSNPDFKKSIKDGGKDGVTVVNGEMERVFENCKTTGFNTENVKSAISGTREFEARRGKLITEARKHLDNANLATMTEVNKVIEECETGGVGKSQIYTVVQLLTSVPKVEAFLELCKNKIIDLDLTEKVSVIFGYSEN